MRPRIILICLILIIPVTAAAQTSQFGQSSLLSNQNDFANTGFLKNYSTSKITADTSEYKRFYLKTETLLSILIPVFSRNAYYTDLQFGYAFTPSFHINAEISRAKTYRFQESVAQNDSNVLGERELKGLAPLGYDISLRLYPFNDRYSALDYFFVGLGAFYHPYSGSTYEHAYNTMTSQYEYQYLHEIEINRYGPKLEVGLSLRDFPVEYYRTDSKLFFSPEILVGVRNVHLNVLKDDVNQMHGANNFEPYDEPPFRFYFRGRVGIGF